MKDGVSARERAPRPSLPAWLLLALLGAAPAGAAGCRAPRHDTRVFETSADHPSRLGSRTLATLTRARKLMEEGDAAGAVALLEGPASASEAPFAVRLMLQDAQLAGADAAGLESAARELAEAKPSAENLLLWARLAPDAGLARAAIEHALALDPRSVWAHYAAAHAHARDGDWVGAADLVQRALVLDPGHRASRRLEAAILARGARPGDAINALELWLEATRNDPRVASQVRAAAQLDLAHLLLLEDEPRKARDLLRTAAPAEDAQFARRCLMAAAEQALGRPQVALEAAQRAAQDDPEALVPLVQIALLSEHDLADRDAALAAWRRVLDATRGDSDLGALIQGLRARISIERAEALAP